MSRASTSSRWQSHGLTSAATDGLLLLQPRSHKHRRMHATLSALSLLLPAVKPKRPAHRIFLGKGSRSSRGLKLSTSRKVRFNEGGEGSPTHKTAAAAAPGRASGAGIAVVAQAVPHATNAATAAGGAAANSERHARFARSSSSDGGTSPPAASTAGAGGAAKAGRRAAGVSFEPLPSSSTASSRTPDNASGAPGSTVVKQQGADTTPSGAAAGHAGATGSSTAAGASQALPALSPAAAAAVQAAKQSLPLSAQRSPSPLQQRPPGLHLQQQQRQQQQHAQGGSSPSGASSVQHGGVGDSALMTRFLQQQPYGLDSPGNNGGSSLDLYGLQAGRQGSASALEKRTARRSTDLVGELGMQCAVTCATCKALSWPRLSPPQGSFYALSSFVRMICASSPAMCTTSHLWFGDAMRCMCFVVRRQAATVVERRHRLCHIKQQQRQQLCRPVSSSSST